MSSVAESQKNDERCSDGLRNLSCERSLVWRLTTCWPSRAFQSVSLPAALLAPTSIIRETMIFSAAAWRGWRSVCVAVGVGLWQFVWML